MAKYVSDFVTLIAFVLLLNFMIYNSYYYITVMKKFQHYEYQRHKWHVIFETVIMAICLSNLIALVYYSAIIDGCKYALIKFYYPEDVETGFCKYFNGEFQNKK